MKFAVVVAISLATAGAYAQNYPARTVRIVVPYAPGGNTDFTARVIATKLADVFGQQVVVENAPAARPTSAPSWSRRRRRTVTRC